MITISDQYASRARVGRCPAMGHLSHRGGRALKRLKDEGRLVQGGDRKSNSHDDSLISIKDLGLNWSTSSRDQML